MKMFIINIFVFTLYVASSIGRPLNGQPSEVDSKGDIQITKLWNLYVASSIGRPLDGQSSEFDSKADIQITKFHVDTSIQMR